MIQHSKQNEDSRKIQLGKNGERFAVSVFERIVGKRRLQKGWYRIEHPDWENNYTHGHGLDIRIYDEDDKPLIDAEVKNWKDQPKPYGTDTASKEINTRFWQSTAPIKILFISFLHLLTYEARELIKQAGIEIIEIGNWIVKATWAKTLKHFMINNYHKLKDYVFPLKPKAIPIDSLFSPSLLSKLSGGLVSSRVIGNSDINNNTYTNKHQNMKEHDTNIAICKRLGLEVTVEEEDKSFG